MTDLFGMLGMLLFAYAAINMTRPQIAPPAEKERWLSPIMGAVGGFMFGLIGSYMVPGVVYIQALGLSRDMFVQALGITFCVIMAGLERFSKSMNRRVSSGFVL